MAKISPLGTFHPQLAVPAAALPRGDGWIIEPKLDGYRALSSIDDGRVRIRSRTGQDWSRRFPVIAGALAALRVSSAVLDGEICALDEQGRPGFQRLQHALAERTADRDALIYFVFDLLFLDGVDLRHRPLAARKSLLAALLEGAKSPLSYLAPLHVNGEDGDDLMKQVCRAGLEGVVAKRGDKPHRARRAPEWVKIKCGLRQEAVIVGYTAPKGTRIAFGALLLGVREAGGLEYAGRAGTGFSSSVLVRLGARLRALRVDSPAVRNAPRLRDATWVRPELVAEIAFTGWTDDGVFRNPSFIGLREDKPAADVRRERPDCVVEGVRISHPDRVLERESGLTKLALARYLDLVAPRMLPHAIRRPLALVRRPGGDPGETFFQKRRSAGMPDSIRGARAGGWEVIYIEDSSGLIALAQFSAVEIHGWGARLPGATRPDRLVMDLDPDESLPFARVVEAARAIRELLRSIGLESFVTTTGGKGLHVIAPIAPRFDFDTAKAVTRAVAERLARDAPDEYVAVMARAARRGGRIFIDYLRNGQGATAILPYSPRARPGAPVATPIAWRDLAHLDPRELTVATIPRLLRRKDPWSDFFTIEQRLDRAALPRDLASRPLMT